MSVKITCDKCGKDCKGVSLDFTVRMLHNYNPSGPTDSSSPCMTHDNSVMRFQLCESCVARLGLPNIYEVQDSHELKFREPWREDKL